MSTPIKIAGGHKLLTATAEEAQTLGLNTITPEQQAKYAKFVLDFTELEVYFLPTQGQGVAQYNYTFHAVLVKGTWSTLLRKLRKACGEPTVPFHGGNNYVFRFDHRKGVSVQRSYKLIELRFFT